MLHRQPTLEEIDAAQEASKLPPKEYFARLVKRGLINWQGKVTKLCGGEVDPEPEAQAYLAQRNARYGGTSANSSNGDSPPLNGNSH